MYQEVAFDPQCLGEYHYYGLLKERFGFEAGRYVVAPVKEWVKEAYQSVQESETMQPIKKKSVKNFLNKLLKSKNNSFVILPLPRKGLTFDNWQSWYEKQHQESPFYVVVSERVLGALDYDSLIDGHVSWSIPPTICINKSAPEIAKILKPLLKLSDTVYLVDQYFSLANNQVLQAIFEMIEKDGTVKNFHLITSVDTKNPKRVFINEYSSNFKFMPKFSLTVVPQKFFHDRYLISNIGAIKAGHGFSEGVTQGAQADKLSLNICSKHESNDVIKQLEKIINTKQAAITYLN
ncbi:hypothetical protein [Pseudoalteromonas sp. NZS11_1]|uniref:hypothetical protein n=1 Tax=Pseudoalteromonas sp. NZS11_1 TaxID=2792070 RepID=UPI0018CEB68E|nr:hypothetical protein [Pseudoalteromonas sp. NZS11_1]MBH0045231.1 hypothetical protein [Pseudoalteromonas sp. NZS11_1]